MKRARSDGDTSSSEGHIALSFQNQALKVDTSRLKRRVKELEQQVI